MTVKDRAQFLIERYGQDSIKVIKDVIDIKDQDPETIKYWQEVLKLCKETVKKEERTLKRYTFLFQKIIIYLYKQTISYEKKQVCIQRQ